MIERWTKFFGSGYGVRDLRHDQSQPPRRSAWPRLQSRQELVNAGITLSPGQLLSCSADG